MKEDINTYANNQDNTISRKEAIQKVGKYAAFTAGSMLLLMSPVDSSANDKSKKPHKPKKH